MKIKKVIVGMVAAGCAAVLIILGFYVDSRFQKHKPPKTQQYEEKIFDKDNIMDINIEIEEEKWEQLLREAEAKQYYLCNVIINGEKINNVGIRTKGNASLKDLSADKSTKRYSFKIEFDHYYKNKTCYGLDKMVLNNIYADKTYMKEYLSYDIMSSLDVKTPLYTYADVKINGETWGLYLAVEAIEESFVKRNYETLKGQLYKPDFTKEGSFYEGMDLAYIDDEISSYNIIFDSAVFTPAKTSEFRKVIEALKHLDLEEDLESYIEVDDMLRYIASNSFLINDDSYFGKQLHNYYLYERDGKLVMLPWDYNLSFAGFRNESASMAVNRPIDSIIPIGSWENRPMIKKLIKNETYKKTYYAYLDELITGYFNEDTFQKKIEDLNALIDSYVKEDPTAFFTYEEYETGRDTLYKFCVLRAKSIEKQLAGILPATHAGQLSKKEEFIDASDIDLEDMGGIY